MGGVVLGVLLFGTLNNILPLIQVSSFWQMGIKGFVIIASVVINSITQQHMDKKALQGGINYGGNSKDKIPFLKIRFIPMGNNDICNIHYHKYNQHQPVQ